MKNNFEPTNSSLLESGFDGVTNRYYMMYVTTPVSKPWLLSNDGKPNVFDMEDFSEDGDENEGCNCDECMKKKTS